MSQSLFFLLFFLISSSIKDLTSPQMYPATLWKARYGSMYNTHMDLTLMYQ